MAEMDESDTASRGLRYEDEETQKTQNGHLVTYRRVIAMMTRSPRDISDEDAETLCFPKTTEFLRKTCASL